MPGEKIRDLPLNSSPSSSAFTYICDGIGGDGKVDKGGLKSWLDLDKPAFSIADWNGIIGYGQSLSVGADSLPIVHSYPVLNHLTFSTGPNYPNGSGLLSSSGLYERLVSNQGETPCSALAEGISYRRLTEGEDDLITFQWTQGVGGYPIEFLDSDSAPYAALIAANSAAESLASAAGKSYVVSAVWWMQGESNESTTQSSYFSQFTNLVNSLRSDLENENGSPEILTYQTCANIAYDTGGPSLAQLQADELDHVHLVTPIYFMEPAEGSNIHLNTASSQEVGFRFARAWQSLSKTGTVDRIRINSVIQQGDSRVVINLNIPTPPLVIDTVRVPSTENLGFEMEDDSGSVPIVSSSVSGSQAILIPGRSIVGDLFVSYGMVHNETPWINGAGGNLRDSTVDTVFIEGSSVSLAHWLPAFKMQASKISSPNYAAGPENGAWEHWIFKTSSASLTGIVNSRVLTPVDTVDYTSQSVSLPGDNAGYLNGLESTFADKLSYTIAAVIKRPLDTAGRYVNILGTNRVVEGDGAGLLIFDDDVPSEALLVNSPGVVSFARPWADAGITPGEWCFVVYRSNAGKSAGMIGGASLLEDSNVRSIPTRNVALGNAYTPYGPPGYDLEFAEAMIFDSVLTESELNELFIRSRSRMAARGITI